MFTITDTHLRVWHSHEPVPSWVWDFIENALISNPTRWYTYRGQTNLNSLVHWFITDNETFHDIRTVHNHVTR